LGAFVAGSFTSRVDSELGGRPLTPAAQSAVKEAKDRSLTVTPANRVPPPQRAVVREALTSASVHAFHIGVGIGAVLVIAGGVVSLLGIVNPRREVPCESCPGGALVGASLDQARVRLPDAEAQPAGA
jgi:hypothetical protein